MTKRIAVQLFGHLRTFRDASASFQEKLVKVNAADGYEIDIFIHTWNEIVDLNPVRGSGRKDPYGLGVRIAPATVENAKKPGPLSDEEIRLVKEIYQPKRLQIDDQLTLSETEKEYAAARKIMNDCWPYVRKKNQTFTVW